MLFLRQQAGRELKESWDRDAELQRVVAQKQREMLERSQRWKADMTAKMTKSFRETGRVELSKDSVRL